MGPQPFRAEVRTGWRPRNSARVDRMEEIRGGSVALQHNPRLT